MSSWSSLDVIRQNIQYEFENAFKIHRDQIIDILNSRIVTNERGECANLQGIMESTIKRSPEILEAHINNAFIFVTSNTIGPVLSTKYKMEVLEMKYNYLSLYDNIQSWYKCGGVSLTFDAMKIFSLNGMAKALSETLLNGFRETLGNSRKKLVTMIIYQMRMSFGKAMEEYARYLIQFIINKVSNADCSIITLIICHANVLFSNLESFAAIRIFHYVRVCIDEALDKYFKPLPVRKIVYFSDIDEMLSIGNFQQAFKLALEAKNIYHLNYICQSVNPNIVFDGNTCLLSYDVLLALVQQLSVSLCHNTHVKIAYLKMALPCLDVQDLVSREHLPYVIKNIPIHLEHLSIKQPSAFNQNDLIQLLNYVKSIFIRCTC